MGEVHADTAALRATGPRFDAVADDVTAAAERLRGAIEAEGECWGADQVGQAFSKDYKPGQTEAQEAIQGLHDVFAGYAKDLPAAADSLQAQDDSIAGDLGATAP
ncbi:type VII secretion target [Nocardia sp. CA-290969]|uniref:type VII secretion target n=1 Tax=Nocardia sp. CA-290969 TaxID=3239986 RepID=UPI003D91CBAC